MSSPCCLIVSRCLSTEQKPSALSKLFPIIIFLTAFLTLWCSSIGSKTACASPPQRFNVENAAFDTQDDTLFFSCSVTVDEESGLGDMLRDGAILELSVQNTLTRRRSWWTDSSIAATTYTSTIRHDPLSRDFIISWMSPTGAQGFKRDRNLTRLIHGTWKKIYVPVSTLKPLRENGSGKDYVLESVLSLRYTEVPPWLQGTMGFWSADVIPDEHITLEFTF